MQITAEEFLNRILYQQTEDDFGLMDVELVSIILDDEGEDDGGETFEDENCEPVQDGISISSSQSSSSQSSSKLGQCVVCCDAEPDICVLPCFELCICESCWSVLKENRDQRPGFILKCPKCESIVTDARTMTFA